MDTDIVHFPHKLFTLPLSDCRICCMLDDGFFRPNQLTGDPHVHMAYELHYCESGCYSVTLSQTGEALTVEPGNVLLVPPGCYHSADFPGMLNEKKWCLSEDVRKYTLRFQPEYYAAEGEPIYDRVQQALQRHPQLIALPRGVAYLRQVSTELCSNLPYAEQAAELALQSFFLLLFRELIQASASAAVALEKSSETDTDLVRYERIIRYLDCNSFKPITEQDLAEEMHLSVRQLTRIFSHQFGATFRQVLRQIRLHQARKLLSRTALSIEQIALKVGYSSPSTFYAAFKEDCGMSPRKYRVHARESKENLLF